MIPARRSGMDEDPQPRDRIRHGLFPFLALMEVPTEKGVLRSQTLDCRPFDIRADATFSIMRFPPAAIRSAKGNLDPRSCEGPVIPPIHPSRWVASQL